jgi:hypothetical protein
MHTAEPSFRLRFAAGIEQQVSMFVQKMDDGQDDGR